MSVHPLIGNEERVWRPAVQLPVMAMLAASAFQNLKIVGPLNMGHLLMLAAGITLLAKLRSLKLPPMPILMFMAFSFAVSLAAGYHWGFSPVLFNYAFALYAIVLIMNFGDHVTHRQWLFAFRLTAVVSLFIVAANAVLNAEAIASYYTNGDYVGHPSYDTVYGGGVNLESSWIGLYAVFFVNTPWGFLYMAASLLLAVLLASRAGLLITVTVMLLYAVRMLLATRNPLRTILPLVAGIAAGVCCLWASGLLDPMISRLTGNHEDKGALGRENIYAQALPFLSEHPFGVGLGNAITAINADSLSPLPDGNIHNLYLQMSMETGLLGGLAFTGMAIWLATRCVRNRFRDEFADYVLLFLVFALIQFAKFEVFPAFALAVMLREEARLDEDERTDVRVSWKDS